MGSIDVIDAANFSSPPGGENYLEECGLQRVSTVLKRRTPGRIVLTSHYQKMAGALCREHEEYFFIHACGKQRDNLAFVSSPAVGGLEGVAYPPFGDVDLDEAMQLTGDDFIITGGISPAETVGLKTHEEVDAYIQRLFDRMRPFAHRFFLSASCNTPVNTSWDTIRWFRDAWDRHADL